MKQPVRLVLYLEIETSDPSPEAIAEVIEDIDSQISGQGREIRVKIDGFWTYVDYQVTHTHGVEKDPSP